jgi:UDPglucose 6-dehydrogenase
MKTASVIGIGKLGLCFALTLEKNGYEVVGTDINPEYVDSINDKTLSSDEEGVENLLKASNNFLATTSLEHALEHSDLLFVVVATPSLQNGRYDHSQVDRLVQTIEELGYSDLQKEFIVCCTTMPGYCDSISQKLEPLNYRVSYNPEFIAQGTILKDQENPDMVLIGEADWESGNLIEEVYKDHTQSNPRICRMSPTEAEITKISLNCFLTTKIAFANMVGDIALASGANPDNILHAIGSDSRIGNKYLRYGFGYGGPCFPRDNRALAIYAKDVGCPALISTASDESNRLHLNEQVKHFMESHDLDEEIVFECVTYKPQSTMLVESQELQYAVRLAQAGFPVTIRERETVVEDLQQTYGDLFSYEYR